MNLKHGPATTAPRGSLHPFRSGQISNLYASYYRPPFACSAFSYPLAQQLTSRVTCHSRTTGVGGQLDLPRSHSCRPECFLASPLSACLFPGSSFDDVSPRMIRTTGLHTVLVRAYQSLWPTASDEVYQQFTFVALTELAWPSRRTATCSVVPDPVTGMGRLSRSTLFLKLHT